MDNAPDFVLFLGRFHPIVVHLPIGFLFFAFLLEVFSRWKKNPVLTAAIPLALKAGALSALVACILGYMLSLSGDYEQHMVDNHFWFGVVTTVVTFLAWLIRVEKIKIQELDTTKTNISALALIVVLISITGHYGGNLTHGSDYLVKYLPFGKKEEKVLPPLANVQDAVVYDYLVDPILQNKCASCHNSSKKKGGLSYEDSTAIAKGGKNGPAFVAGDASKSELIQRVTLHPEHEDFMPPEGKTPLTDEEIAILTYWIDKAKGDFTTKVVSVETPDEIMGIASHMLGIKRALGEGEIELPTVSAVDENILLDLENAGFNIRELVYDSNLFEVTLPSKTITEANNKEIDAKLEKLLQIKDNIIRLSMSDNGLEDKHLKIVGQFVNLQLLRLERNPITDAGVLEITNNTSITTLNLYGTKITKNSLEAFSKMQNLQKVYIWQTGIGVGDVEKFSAQEDIPELVFGI